MSAWLRTWPLHFSHPWAMAACFFAIIFHHYVLLKGRQPYSWVMTCWFVWPSSGSINMVGHFSCKINYYNNFFIYTVEYSWYWHVLVLPLAMMQLSKRQQGSRIWWGQRKLLIWWRRIFVTSILRLLDTKCFISSLTFLPSIWFYKNYKIEFDLLL